MRDFCDDDLDGIELIEPEGTYLGWLDCRALKMDQAELNNFMIHQAGIGLNDGAEFGDEGKGFMRLNFACPRAVLEQGLDKLKQALWQM